VVKRADPLPFWLLQTLQLLGKVAQIALNIAVMAYKLRVMCVDDSNAVLDSVCAFLSAQPDMECAERLLRSDDLVMHARNCRADIVLLDLDVPGPSPFTNIRELAELGIRTIVLSGFVDKDLVDEAILNGACGYLSKLASPKDILSSIRLVARDEVIIGTEVKQLLRANCTNPWPSSLSAK
jgi:DNA-binding NarL/FixJ family response regulator